MTGTDQRKLDAALPVIQLPEYSTTRAVHPRQRRDWDFPATAQVFACPRDLDSLMYFLAHDQRGWSIVELADKNNPIPLYLMVWATNGQRRLRSCGSADGATWWPTLPELLADWRVTNVPVLAAALELLTVCDAEAAEREMLLLALAAPDVARKVAAARTHPLAAHRQPTS